MNRPTFLIIDGSSLLVRAYFATAYGGRMMRSGSGHYTNGLFGFLNMLFKLVEEMSPTHLLCAWDVSRDTFRRELFPAYKGTRGELPDELGQQFTTTQEVLASMGVAQLLDERYEADDLIGTMAFQAVRQGHHVTIVTGDRDALQLVREGITVALTKRGVSDMDYVTPERLVEIWGIRPEQVPDLKGLMGDTSDNIPGVPGIGEKTALKLLAEHASLETLLEQRHTIRGKVREKLDEHFEIALLSKRLATIVTDVPLDLSHEDCRLSVRLEEGTEKLRELDLSRFTEQLKRITPAG